MLDIIVFCLVDYNMQYGLSAKRLARKKNSIFAWLSNNATPTAQHSGFLFHAKQIIQYFCAYLHAGGWSFKIERNHLRCIYRSMEFRGIIIHPSYIIILIFRNLRTPTTPAIWHTAIPIHTRISKMTLTAYSLKVKGQRSWSARWCAKPAPATAASSSLSQTLVRLFIADSA